MKFCLVLPCMACAATVFAVSHVEVSALPQGEFADTEVSTNVPFRTSKRGVKALDVRIEHAGSESNCVEVAFGHDADGNGDLATEETR